METFTLKVIGFSRVFYEGEAVQVQLPIQDGSMGIMAHHEAAVISLVKRMHPLPLYLDAVPFQNRNQDVIHEMEQLVTGHGILDIAGIRPVAPAVSFWNHRLVSITQLAFFFLEVENLQEDQPNDLRQPLRVPVDAFIFSHDLAKSFNQCG